MDLSFSAEEAAFAQEIRAWIAANLELPPRFATLADEVEWGRAWQAKLAAGRWVGIHWPVAYGGRGASPVQVAIFNMEYARSRALQPVNRVGINLAGPTLLAHGDYVFVDSRLGETGRAAVFYTGDLITYRYPLHQVARRLDLVYSAQGTRIYR